MIVIFQRFSTVYSYSLKFDSYNIGIIINIYFTSSKINDNENSIFNLWNKIVQRDIRSSLALINAIFIKKNSSSKIAH